MVQTFTEDTIPDRLMQEHYNEVAAMKEHLKLNMNWDEYARMQGRGELLFVGAYAREKNAMLGMMIGYVIMVIRPHMHYQDTILAVDDAHYLSPEFRRGDTGSAMLRFAERAARDRGANMFSMRCKADHDHGALFERMGYKFVDKVYVKDLRHETSS